MLTGAPGRRRGQPARLRPRRLPRPPKRTPRPARPRGRLSFPPNLRRRLLPLVAAGGYGGIPVDQLQGRQIGRVLVKMNKVTREQLVAALSFQKEKGGAIGRILIDSGYIKEADLSMALAAQKGIEFANLDGRTIPPEAIEAVPRPDRHDQ